MTVTLIVTNCAQTKQSHCKTLPHVDKVTHPNNMKNCTITPHNSCQENMSCIVVVVIVTITTKKLTSRTHQRKKMITQYNSCPENMSWMVVFLVTIMQFTSHIVLSIQTKLPSLQPPWNWQYQNLFHVSMFNEWVARLDGQWLQICKMGHICVCLYITLISSVQTIPPMPSSLQPPWKWQYQNQFHVNMLNHLCCDKLT